MTGPDRFAKRSANGMRRLGVIGRFEALRYDACPPTADRGFDRAGPAHVRRPTPRRFRCGARAIDVTAVGPQMPRVCPIKMSSPPSLKRSRFVKHNGQARRKE